LRPYLSLDIEATGLTLDKIQTLQIAGVIDDGISPIEDLTKFSFLIKNDLITHGEPYALGLNAWIFQEIFKSIKGKKTKYPVVSLEEAFSQIHLYFLETQKLAIEWDKENNIKRPSKRIQMAGKNFSAYDRPVLEAQGLKIMSELTHHRVIDIGPMYFEDFGYVPSGDEINKLLGFDAITHDALDDALDVVKAIRKKVK